MRTVMNSGIVPSVPDLAILRSCDLAILRILISRILILTDCAWDHAG